MAGDLMAGALVDHLGRPVRRLDKAVPERPGRAKLEAMGVQFREDGGLEIPGDALAAVRAERRRAATMSHMPSTPRMLMRDAGGVGVMKGLGQFVALSFEQLRVIRRQSPLLKAIHAARQHQIRRLACRWPGKRGTVGWRVVHKDHMDYRATPPGGFDQYIQRFTAVLERPAPSYRVKNTGDLLGPLWEDLATLNRPAVEILRAAYDDREIVGFRPVDGGLVFETFRWLERWLAANPLWAQGYTDSDLVRNPDRALTLISERIGHDLTQADWCLVRDGTVDAVYSDRDLVVAPLQTSTDVRLAGYPPSYVEEAVDFVLAHAAAHEYNSTFFTRGMTTETIIGVAGDVHDDDLEAFADMLREATRGVTRAHTVPIMPLPVEGTLQMLNLKANNKDMLFEGWVALLIALATSIYRMDPSTINSKSWAGGRGPSLSEPSRDQEIDLALEEGLQGDYEHLRDSVLNELARTCHPDLRVLQEYGHTDQQREAAIFETSGRTYRTRNELRLEAGLAPIGFWAPPEDVEDLGDERRQKYDGNPWNLTTDPTMLQALQASQAAQQAQQPQRGPQGQPGAPGQPQALPPGPADDGFGEPPPDYPWGQDQALPGERPEVSPEGLRKGRRTWYVVEDT